jgi:CheY-like chemotaxis protein/HD-like signal output (HDOD) protein
MAYILLVDPDEVAHRAMRGILARGNHRFVAVNTAADAWDFIQRTVKVDIVIVEMALEGDGGLAFIQRLKSDCCLKLLPVLVYTAKGDRETVKRVLDLRAQNFLIKPYHDDVIFSEIAKAVVNPWRQQHFEEEKSFCKMMGFTPDVLHKMLDDLRTTLPVARTPLQKWAGMRATQPACDEITILSTKAEEAGAWGVVEYLKQLTENAQSSKWEEFEQNLEWLEFAGRLIFRHLNASLVPEEFLSSQELNAEIEAKTRAVWSNAVAENRCPVVRWPQLQQEIENLAGCPVIDSAVAAFQMTANGHPTSLAPLMDLVDKNPGLAAQMLIASNKLKRASKDDLSLIEDPRMAIGLLGEIRLAAQGRALVTAEERMMLAPPLCSWSHFWMFQMGTARIARYTCRYLELTGLESPAYTAGLLHDLGKLLLLRLHPFAFQAILAHARQNELAMSVAERHFLGVTTHEMAAHFADKHGLPRRFANVMRWVANPEQATEDVDLVAIVSLARTLCRNNHVGFCGDTPETQAIPLEETAEWRVLRGSVFPSFDLKKFESQVHAECRQLKHELHGRMANYAVA